MAAVMDAKNTQIWYDGIGYKDINKSLTHLASKGCYRIYIEKFGCIPGLVYKASLCQFLMTTKKAGQCIQK